jgi:hypothetical protein
MADPIAIKRAEAEKIWRADMKQLGADVVRTRFTARMPVTDRMPYPDSAFVQMWLDQKGRNAKIWAGFVTAVSIVAMIAACIAAWPVVNGWLN